jgi:HprK-related kinase A
MQSPRGLGELYGQFEVRNPRETFADFHVSVDPQTKLRQGLRPKVNFSFDGIAPFEPEPLDQAYPMLERGLDWCVSEHAHQYLMIHAAVVEKNDQAVILPAAPDAGKSTLVAALVLSGWRLLSDELALIDRKTGWIHPLPRPIRLKNESIPLIRAFHADAYFSGASCNSAQRLDRVLCAHRKRACGASTNRQNRAGSYFPSGLRMGRLKCCPARNRRLSST